LRSVKSSFLPSTQTLKGQQQREAPGVVSWRRIKKKESGFVSAAALFSFLEKRKDKEVVKRELLAAIQPLDRGAQATADDLANIDKIARELESLNPTKEPLKLSLLNGKWRLVYTTSESVLRKQVPLLLKGGFYDDFLGNSAFDEWIMNWYHHLEGKVIKSLSLMCLQ
jgi:hypothetical protein